MNESKHTDFRLEIWNGKSYTRTYAYSDGSRDQHNDVIRALMHSDDGLMADPKLMTYRIVRCDKKRPMTGKANWATSQRRRNDDGMDIKKLAELGATHYHSLRTRDLHRHGMPGIKTEVPVYPVKPSGRGTASEFRLMLASLLTGGTRHGAFWGWSMNKTRIHVEKELADHGFRFVEVDAGDYA
jgi:hypothetical protein